MTQVKTMVSGFLNNQHDFTAAFDTSVYCDVLSILVYFYSKKIFYRCLSGL